MRKVLFFSLALAVLLLAVTLLGCGGGKSLTASSLNGSTYGSIDEALAELEALTPPEGVDPALFEQLKDAFREALESGGGKITCTPSAFFVNDLAAPDPQTDPPTITWSSDFFVADGDINGAVTIADITPIAVHFGQQWIDDQAANYNLLAKPADYDRNGTVAIADITPLAQTFQQTTGSFVVEWSETEDFATTAALGSPVLWDDMEAAYNANGFAVYIFEVDAAVFPPAADSVWLRVTPRDSTDVPGLPCTAFEFDLGGVQPALITVTDILVQVEGAVNTEPGSDLEGTEYFHAPGAGGDTFGETPANTAINVILSDIAYQYEGVPYEFGAVPPPAITADEWEDIWADLHDSMAYSVVSDEVPVDPEAWEESDPQEIQGYQGTVGPNDPGALKVTATMTDNDYTPLALSYPVSIAMGITDDVNAPEIFNFQPLEQPQNKTMLVTVRMEWGEDEVGDELPAETNDGLAMYDATTGAFVMTFTPPDPPNPVETHDPPTVPGQYTLFRLPGEDFTTNILVLVPSGLTQGDYIWRTSEMNGTFERRSSLKKPTGEVYTVVGPEYFDMYTWPQGGPSGSFSVVSSAQPYLYFFPDDPKVRRNPRGHREGDPGPPVFVPDDQIAYDDFIKGDEDTGNEFLIVFGALPNPDSPRVFYLYGTTPAMTMGEADGELPINYRQPHMIAATVFGLLTEEGDITFSLFDNAGTFLGFVSHYASLMPQPRSAPVIDLDCGFGVRPWGAGLDPEDFSDNSASKGASDVVVFTAKNVWLRHDDGLGMDQFWRSSHLWMTLSGSGQIPEQLLLTPIVGPNPEDLVYMMIDVANPDWWQNITREIEIGEFDLLQLETPGAGTADYIGSLFVVP